MAQSNEARLNKQVNEALQRNDFNIAQFAMGTTAYDPFVKERLALVIVAIAQMNDIDWTQGNFQSDEHDTVKFLAGLYRYVTGLDSRPGMR